MRIKYLGCYFWKNSGIHSSTPLVKKVRLLRGILFYGKLKYLRSVLRSQHNLCGISQTDALKVYVPQNAASKISFKLQ